MRTLNLLMIGNSFCYYFVEELYGMLAAAGIPCRIGNIYYSGCTIEEHWNWWQTGEANYSYYTTDENGRVGVKNVDLEYCLAQQDWDIISLQDGRSYSKLAKNTPETACKALVAVAEPFYEKLKSRFPDAKFLWHSTWAPEIGFHRDSTGFRVTSVQDQRNYEEKQKELARLISNHLQIPMVSTGKAWPIARKHPLANNLCKRIGIRGAETFTGVMDDGDGYHDGDIGGGQYLNACVWFEFLSGQSCIGNSYRPDYPLSEELIRVLQNAAHQSMQL